MISETAEWNESIACVSSSGEGGSFVQSSQNVHHVPMISTCLSWVVSGFLFFPLVLFSIPSCVFFFIFIFLFFPNRDACPGAYPVLRVRTCMAVG